MNENNKGMGSFLLIILFAVFTALKMTGVVSWSWWWVTSPLWMPFAIYAGCVVLLIAWALFMIPFSFFF